MILTQCAACAAPLGLSLGKKCGRCSTRYCGPECQVQHWKEGGHDQLCKKIKKAGGAEKYHADKKLKEAVAVAAKACAEDTKGQTCFICTQALHWKTKEGLVRGCACRGTAGFAHVSCLAEQAKILFAEAEENNLGDKVWNERWNRWHRCSLCEQGYHGAVACALGWACWKTYVGRPEADEARRLAMTQLGNGLSEARHYEDALTVEEAKLSMLRRFGASENFILVAQGNLANTYENLGQRERALALRREVYTKRRVLMPEHRDTLLDTINLASSLIDDGHFAEARKLINETLPIARRVCGDAHDLTLGHRYILPRSVVLNPDATQENLRVAKEELEDLLPTTRRIFGNSHPRVELVRNLLEMANRRLSTEF